MVILRSKLAASPFTFSRFWIQNRDLTVWPGYDTTIREYEDKLLLGIDTRFKIMRTDTAMQVMEKILRKVGNSGGDLKVRYLDCSNFFLGRKVIGHMET